MNYQTTEVRGLDHIGLTVPDLEAASAFLEKAFGAVRLYDNIVRTNPSYAGPEAEGVLGIVPGAAVLAMRMLRIGDGPGLELFEMRVPGQERQPAARPSDVGLQHFAVYTDDVSLTTSRFEKAGGTLLAGPNPMLGIEKGPGNGFRYGKTPWGTVVEFISYPSPLAYEKTTDRRRWKPVGGHE